LVWWGTATFALIRKSSDLGFGLSLLLTLGLILSWLPNYLVTYGMFGHLLAMTAFITALEQLVPDHKENWSGPQPNRRLLFPLLVLYLSYQGGYLPSVLLLILFGALQTFGQTSNRSFLKRSFNSLLQGFRPVFIVTLILIIVMPGIFSHMLERLMEIATQTSGWTLPLFNPLIFSGLPYYPPDFYYNIHRTETNQISLCFYILFILFVLSLLFFLMKQKGLPLVSKKINSPPDLSAALAKKDESRSQAAVMALTGVFLFSLIVYLAAFLTYGNVYKTWKFAAYTVLPLSFLPLTLFFALLAKYLTHRRKLITVLALTLAAGFPIQFVGTKVTDIPEKYFRMVSASSLVSILSRISTDIPRDSTVIVSMESWSRNLMAAMVLANNQSSRIKFDKTFFHILHSPFNFNSLTNKTYILSDANYDGIIKGQLKSHNLGQFYLYDYSRIQTQGYLELKGNDLNEDRLIKYSAFNWQLGPSPVYGSLLIPKDKIGKDLNLSAELKPLTVESENCRYLLGYFRSGQDITWQSGQALNLNIFIPAIDNQTGLLKFILKTDPQNQPEFGSQTAIPCSFQIIGFAVN
jgi:hypothetical protein